MILIDPLLSVIDRSTTGGMKHEMVLDIHKGSQKHIMGLSSVGA